MSIKPAKHKGGNFSNNMIRKAFANDVSLIQEIIKPYADRGEMLPRSLNDLYENIRDFSVYEKDNKVLGVVALHVSWEDIAEIRSLAIREGSLFSGVGSALVKYCLEEARSLHLKKAFVLTYSTGFFQKLGFSPVEKENLPHKIWKDCISCSKFPACDEQALIMEL